MTKARKRGLALLVLFLAPLSVVLSEAQPVRSQTPGQSEGISITDSGFIPDFVTVVAGDTVNWTNDSSSSHSVTADFGPFDSGSFPPQAAFSAIFTTPGDYPYSSTNNANFAGVVRVVLTGLPGPSDGPANDNIPDITFPIQSQEDISDHPMTGIPTSRTRILLGFEDSATVAEAKSAIQTAGGVIIGALPTVDTLLAEAVDTTDFSGLPAALGSLRANPVVDFAAPSPEAGLADLPRPAEALLFASSWDWTWSVPEILPLPAFSLIEEGGNWGLEGSKLPQAWNLRGVIQRQDLFDSVVTGIVDSGYEKHPDNEKSLSIDVICKTMPSGPNKCTASQLGNHGQHVSGINGAAYDNSSVEPGRSLGVSGANPFAKMSGVVYQYQSSPLSHADMHEIIALALEEMPNLRVLNLSLANDPLKGDAWWSKHGTDPTCGPGNNDDNTSAANQFCTPNNQDQWLVDMDSFGGLATNIAERASDLGVTIVQAAGNHSSQYCIGTFVNSVP